MQIYACKFWNLIHFITSIAIMTWNNYILLSLMNYRLKMMKMVNVLYQCTFDMKNRWFHSSRFVNAYNFIWRMSLPKYSLTISSSFCPFLSLVTIGLPSDVMITISKYDIYFWVWLVLFNVMLSSSIHLTTPDFNVYGWTIIHRMYADYSF